MRWNPSVLTAVAMFALTAAVGLGSQSISVAHAACAPGEKIDGSTADQAKKKIEAAGFSGARGFAKSCDNFWHATATKNGAPVRILVSPSGAVQIDGE